MIGLKFFINSHALSLKIFLMSLMYAQHYKKATDLKVSHIDNKQFFHS